MEENNILVKSFENSIGIDIAELTGNTVDFCIDTSIEDDSILKDVPFWEPPLCCIVSVENSQ